METYLDRLFLFPCLCWSSTLLSIHPSGHPWETCPPFCSYCCYSDSSDIPDSTEVAESVRILRGVCPPGDLSAAGCCGRRLPRRWPTIAARVLPPRMAEIGASKSPFWPRSSFLTATTGCISLCLSLSLGRCCAKLCRVVSATSNGHTAAGGRIRCLLLEMAFVSSVQLRTRDRATTLEKGGTSYLQDQNVSVGGIQVAVFADRVAETRKRESDKFKGRAPLPWGPFAAGCVRAPLGCVRCAWSARAIQIF